MSLDTILLDTIELDTIEKAIKAIVENVQEWDKDSILKEYAESGKRNRFDLLQTAYMVYKYMTEKGLTVRDAADDLGWSKSHICDMAKVGKLVAEGKKKEINAFIEDGFHAGKKIAKKAEKEPEKAEEEKAEEAEKEPVDKGLVLFNNFCSWIAEGILDVYLLGIISTAQARLDTIKPEEVEVS